MAASSQIYSENWATKQSRNVYKACSLANKEACVKLESRKVQLLKRFAPLKRSQVL